MTTHTTVAVKQLCTDYVRAFTTMLERLDLEAIERTADLIHTARIRGNTVYVAGNGGSASTASHWVNDLGKATKAAGVPPIRAMSLSDNVSWLTALANDEGYDRVFAGQLENFAQPGDVLLVISASGNSENLLRAVAAARDRGVTTVAFLGFDGGLLKGAVDDCVLIPSDNGAYGLVESGHSFIGHILTTALVHPDRLAAAVVLQ
jgi:D-sedoheptulose 7-phosphate isomerase